MELNRAQIGKQAPMFEMNALTPEMDFKVVSLKENMEAGKWTVLYFYPADFSFVCPTEIQQSNRLAKEFRKEDAVLIACSTDLVYSHMAWVMSGTLFPNDTLDHYMASDANHVVSKALGIYDEEKGVAWRGTFIIAPDGTLWNMNINFGEAGRNITDTLENLKRCKYAAEGKSVPCGWTEGDDFIKKG